MFVNSLKLNELRIFIILTLLLIYYPSTEQPFKIYIYLYPYTIYNLHMHLTIMKLKPCIK